MSIRVAAVLILASLAMAFIASASSTVIKEPDARAQVAKTELLVGSCYTHNILRFDAATGRFLGEFVHAGAGGLDCPEGTMLVGPDGDIYVTNFSPPRVRPTTLQIRDSVLRYNGKTGKYVGVAARPSPSLSGPHGLLFLPEDIQKSAQLVISTRFTGSITRYDPQKAKPVQALMKGNARAPADITTLLMGQDGSLLATDYDNGAVLRLDPRTGKRLSAFVPAHRGGLVFAHNMTFGPDGNLYVTNYPANDILRFNGKSGAFMGQFVKPNSGGLDFPATIAFLPNGRLVATRDPKDSVNLYDGRNGKFIRTLVAPGAGGLSGATTLLVRQSG